MAATRISINRWTCRLANAPTGNSPISTRRPKGIGKANSARLFVSRYRNRSASTNDELIARLDVGETPHGGVGVDRHLHAARNPNHQDAVRFVDESDDDGILLHLPCPRSGLPTQRFHSSRTRRSSRGNVPRLPDLD